jgi:hypothetical protein
VRAVTEIVLTIVICGTTMLALFVDVVVLANWLRGKTLM